jgi:phosphoserine phosphatase
MEVLQELTMEVGGEVSRAVALEQMRKMAREVGADAVLDVVVTDGRHDMPLYQMAAMPVVLLGSLVSLMAWTPDPVADAVAAARRPPVQRKVKVVTGVAVKYVR